MDQLEINIISINFFNIFNSYFIPLEFYSKITIIRRDRIRNWKITRNKLFLYSKIFLVAEI